MIDSLYLGPEYDLSDIEGDVVNTMYVARLLEERNIVAIYQGRSEAGPRALGNRSILANAYNPKMRDILNLKVKRRPKYQPFCPSILSEDRVKLFEDSFDHKNLNVEVPEFLKLNPTAENIAVVIYNKLISHISDDQSLEIILYETPRNFVKYSGEK